MNIHVAINRLRPTRHLLQREAPKSHSHMHSLPCASQVSFENREFHHDAFFDPLWALIDSDDPYELRTRVPKIQEGFLYFACYPGQENLVKMGRTAKLPAQRLADLSRRTSAPCNMELWYAIQTPMMGDAEKSLHRAFADHRVKGEWFDMTPTEVLHAVLAIASGHADLRAECRVWATNLPLMHASPQDMFLLRTAGLGQHCETAKILHQAA